MSEQTTSRWRRLLMVRGFTPRRTPLPVPAPRASVFFCRLPHHAASVRAARHAAEPVLTCWGLDPDTVHDVLLVVSELVTNAVEHARPPLALHLRAVTGPEPDPGSGMGMGMGMGTGSGFGSGSDGGAGIRVDVTDGGPALAPGAWAAGCHHDERGRGLQIITALTRGSGTVQADHATDRWATF